MGLKKTLFLLLLALSGNDPVNCQTNISSGSDTIDYYTGNSIVYDNHTYKPSIQSIMLFKQGFELTDPILQLYTDKSLNCNSMTWRQMLRNITIRSPIVMHHGPLQKSGEMNTLTG